MPTVAELLRTAREEQKLNIYQVAEITKIKTDHIRALEAGQYDAFSAPVYIRGFVRTYAKALKLDVAKVTSALDAELSRTDRFSEPPPLTNQPKGALDFLMLQLSKLNWRIVGTVVAAGVVLLVLFISLRGCGGRRTDPLKKLGPGLYQPTNATGELLPLPERKR
jgi:cytoskeletal protein RodZ